MGANTNIEWSTHTFNPWRGCTKISAGCEHCYAERLSKRNPAVLGWWGEHGNRVVAAAGHWQLPPRWNAVAAKTGERARIFCGSLCDIFEDWRRPFVDHTGTVVRRRTWLPGRYLDPDDDDNLTQHDVRYRLFRLIRDTPHVDWLLLTKRPEQIERLTLLALPDAAAFLASDNVWLGVSVEDQESADRRIESLVKIRAGLRFVSYEPALGPIDFARWINQIDWLIVGGESGGNARPMHPDWARRARDQSCDAIVPFFFKQWGGWFPDADRGTHWFEDCDEGEFFRLRANYLAMADGELMGRAGKRRAGRQLDGVEWNELP